MNTFYYNPRRTYCYRCIHSHYIERNKRVVLYCRARDKTRDKHAEGCKEYCPNHGPTFARALQEWRKQERGTTEYYRGRDR